MQVDDVRRLLLGTFVRPPEETGGAPLDRVPDPSMYIGSTVVEESGEPSRSTSVRRRVYTANGNLLYDNTWYSSYRGEPRIVHVGTKPRPVPPVKKGPTGPTGPSGPSGPTGVTSQR